MITQTIALEDPLWRQVLQTIRHDTYHLPEYVMIESQRNQATAEAFIARDGEHLFFAPYLIRSCTELFPGYPPAQVVYDAVSPYGYSGLIMSETARRTPEFAQSALAALSRTLKTKGICSVFFRMHPILAAENFELFDAGTLVKNGVTVSVDLTQSESTMWARTRKGHQSTINKCKRLGLTARMVPISDYLDEFISIYTETMDRVTAKQNFYFDRTYFESLLSLGEALHCCIVELQDQIVATSLFFECCGIVQAHLGGTRTKFMTQSPFSLLLHYVRLWAKERGNTFLHLGGGVGASDSDPLFRFKSGFSRQQHDLYTVRLIVDAEAYQGLVIQRAQDLSLSPDQLLQTSFFPAYRTLP